MSRSTIMTILRYSIVIMLLALCMFFWVDIQEPEFVAVCLTMVFCFLVFSLGVLRLIVDQDTPIGKKKAVIVLCVYMVVCVVAVILRFLV